MAQISYDKFFTVVVNSLDEAVELSNFKAPEHLELCFKNAGNLINKFINYGSMFIGSYLVKVFKDYVSGTNHALPANA